jgi:hypothetical protein
MERRKIAAAFDDHDFEQLVLLAKLNRIKPSELVRRLVKAHLDKGKAGLREEMKQE